MAMNKEQVLTYAQIYEKVWGEDAIGDENISVGYHVRSLHRKLYQKYPNNKLHNKEAEICWESWMTVCL